MTEERKEQLWDQIRESANAGAELDSKDLEVLEQLIWSSPMVKALGHVYARAFNAPTALLGLDLMQPSEVSRAIRLQGAVEGAVQAIDTILTLPVVEVREVEVEDGSPAIN